MGRLDDAAKHKVVELRKAGLSFRKIKAVLELENIKVSAQAIYLYLREFQGRPPGRDRASAPLILLHVLGYAFLIVHRHRWHPQLQGLFFVCSLPGVKVPPLAAKGIQIHHKQSRILEEGVVCRTRFRSLALRCAAWALQ
ncbi:hypothetical protein GOODEAATRI_016698 [Goodea atripinnis]|uniref:Uncharacterized protein n=1 Tax=Goodea atripinnis TaxID=208336 RepID=A0ABV0MIE5_9TELE